MNTSTDLIITNIRARAWLTRLLTRNSLFLILLLFGCVGLAATGLAVMPAPDGGYPNFTTAEGQDALFSLTTGANNTAIGYQALYNNMNGGANTATGYQALFNNISGQQNTATGQGALTSNTTASGNTADGSNALASNTTGINNTATGITTLFFNRTGSANTATGANALLNNRTGNNNTANGANGLLNNTTGNNNTASGANALSLSTAGNNNTGNGVGALRSNTAGNQNVASGANALFHNTTGNNNTANGVNALVHNTTGSGNIALGASAGSTLTDGSNNIDIGNSGFVGAESNTIRIGHAGTHTSTFIAGVSGTAVTGATVVVNSSGQLGIAPSSKRFKDQIKPMDNVSEALLALKPVTFCYKQEIDPKGILQFGLVAEEVEKVNPDLVVRDAEGKVYTVRYEAVNAMLLNEFLKEHRKVQDLEATVAQQQKGFESKIAYQQTQIEALTAGLQRVSAQVEMNRPAAQTALNSP